MKIIGIILRYWVWPIFLFIIIMIFKKQISEFLQRLKTFKISSIGVEVGAASEQQKRETKKPFPPKEEIGRWHFEKVINEYIKLFNKYQFERTFNIIFGTQIGLLEHLLIKGTLGEKYIGLRYFYNECIRRTGLFSYKMEEYIGFLKNMRYVEYVGEGYQMIVKITEYGRNFLSYIKEQYPQKYKYKFS